MSKRATLYLMCALTFVAFGAVAQETTDGAGSPGVIGKPVHLDTVVVTARRRDEALQQVPLSVTALDALELQSRGAEDLSALGAAVPNLTIYPTRAFNGAVTAYIRGVGQADPVWGVDPGVAVYVDDVYLARPQAALLEILDVERIEVLRGPQGTLYGKNTIGGAIKYVTRQVDDEFSGNVGVTVGNYHRRDFKAVVNVPMGERLRTRVAFGSFNRGGFGRNLITGEDVSDKDVMAARVTADWFPSDFVDVRLSYDRYVDRSGVRGAKRLTVNPLDPLRTPPNANNYDVQNDPPNADYIDAEGLSTTVDWQPDARWRLKSITAHRKGSSEGHIDFDTLPLPISTLFRRFFDEQTSQEFQWHWNTDHAHAIAGLYYFDGEAGGAGFNISRIFAITEGVVKTDSIAVYGDLTLDFSDRLSMDAGLRYTSEKKAVTAFNRSYTDATFTTPTGSVTANFSDSTTFHSLSPRINVSYKLTNDAMLYVQASRGFKSGGYNIRANTRHAPESALPYEDETATSYELGAKTQWGEGQLTLNAAVFHNDYRDIQLSVFTSFDADGNGTKESFFGDFTNAGAGTINGAELELGARTGNLKWLGHVGYLNPRYDEFMHKGVNIADSQRFSNAPRWTSGLSAIADIPLRSTGSLVARIDGRYQSKVYPTTDLNQAIEQEGYALWNTSLTWRSPREQWQVALMGQNLTNREYLTTGFSSQADGIGFLTGFYGPPRTVSLSVTYLF